MKRILTLLLYFSLCSSPIPALAGPASTRRLPVAPTVLEKSLRGAVLQHLLRQRLEDGEALSPYTKSGG